MIPFSPHRLVTRLAHAGAVLLLAAMVLLATAPLAPAVGTALLVESFSSAPAVAVAGESFDLTIVLRNHTKGKARNVQVSIGSAPSAGDLGAAEGLGGAAEGGVDLAVVGTGNTLRIGTIDAESTEKVTFKLAADPAARAGVHALPVTVTYETQNAAEQLVQSLGVRVTRLARLNLTAFELPAELIAGEPFEVLAEVMNTGEVRAGGVVLSLQATGPGEIGLEGGRQTVGALEPGDLDMVEATVTAPEAGAVDIVFSVTYTDALGESHETTETRTVTVIEPEVPDTPQDATGGGGGFFTSVAAFFRALFGLGE